MSKIVFLGPSGEALNDRPAKDAPREEHEAYAKKHEFFWMPCRRCGKFFGGHEIAGGEGGHWWTSPGTGDITCPDCPGDFNTEARDGGEPISVFTIPPHIPPLVPLLTKRPKGTKPS